MEKVSITRRFQWAMGHTLKDHDGPCRNLHGHNYVGYFTLEAPELDGQGMVLDFGKIKEVIGRYIDGEVDHRFFVNYQDSRCLKLLDVDSTVVAVQFNPTAENLAIWLMNTTGELMIPFGMSCTKVLLYETENCYAEVTRE